MMTTCSELTAVTHLLLVEQTRATRRPGSHRSFFRLTAFSRLPKVSFVAYFSHERLTKMLFGGVCLLMGCGPAVAVQSDGGTDSDGSPSSSGAVPPPGTTALPMPSTSPPDPTLPQGTSATSGQPGTGSTSELGGDTLGDSACGFLCDPDVGGGAIQCSLFNQDCPVGEKCAPWATDGGSSWNAAKCVPVADDPDAVGESCTAEGGGVSGIDTCNAESMCFNVDSDTNIGECYAFCEGDPSAPVCDPGHACPISGDGVLSICVPTCDPTNPASCTESEACLPWANDFLCAPATDQDGAFLDPCEFLNACEAGLICSSAGSVDDCQPESGCCTPFCTLEKPECPGTTACEPYFGEGQAPVGLEHVGVCIN